MIKLEMSDNLYKSKTLFIFATLFCIEITENGINW